MTIRNLLVAVSLACAPAFADIVQVNLDSSQITAAPGETITFSGTIVNNEAATVDLNNISVSLGGMFSVDVSPFFLGPFSAAGNSNTGDFDYFNVTVDVPYTDPLGVMDGTVTILGGIDDPDAQDDLGSADFSVDVEGLVASTPEPSALVLLLTAIALVFAHQTLRRPGKYEETSGPANRTHLKPTCRIPTLWGLLHRR